MCYKSIFLCSVCALIVLTGSCHKSSPTSVTNPSAKSFGTFLVSLKGDVDDAKITTVLGVINDGPSPSGIIYEKTDSVGECVLYKSRVPFCQQSCGSEAMCVENDSCMAYPTTLDAGLVAVSGFKINNVKTPFSMEYLAGNYQSPTLDLPPCSEGDTVTFAVAGASTVPAFTLSARGITPLVLLNDSFPCPDGQPLDVRWAPPTVTGISSIYILIDISYHGTSKGKIECNGEDDGSLTIPATLLDKLKTYGISGYPKIEIYRRSIGTNTTANTKLIFESKVIRFLSIPGIISCSNNSQCPNGTCGSDQRCH